MKKLYRKGTVHPTPPLVSDHLSFLPATILTLTVALSPEDRQVLAYLLSCSTTNFSGNFKSSTTTTTNNNNNRSVTSVRTSSSGGGVGGARSVVDDHPPSFNCYCFRCYMSYWIRWDSSPNRQLIHEIIDAFEDSLLVQNKKSKGKKDRKKGKVSARSSSNEDELINSESTSSTSGKDANISDSITLEENDISGDVPACGGVDVCVDDRDLGFEKGSVRRLFSFVGEKIWGIWT